MSIWESIGRAIGRATGSPVAVDAGEASRWREEIQMYNASRVRLFPLRDSISNPTNETEEIRKSYPSLLREPTLKGAFFGSMFNVASLELNCTPAGGRSATDKDRECAEFMRHYILGRRQSCLHLVESLGFGGRIHGFSVNHKKRKKEAVGRWAGNWVIERFKPKPVIENRIELEVDEFNNITAVKANWPNRGQRYDPADYVVFTYLRLFDSHTGMSDFRAARRAIMLKESSIKLRMIALDKFTGPYIKGKYPAGQETTRAYLESQLKKARAEGYIVVPQGCEVDVIDLAMKSSAEFKSAIDDFDREIAISVNFASLHMFTSQQSDPRGDAKVQQQTSQIGDWYVAALIAETLQEQVIPEGVEDNFGATYDHPIVTVGGVSAAEILKELEVDDKLLNSLRAPLVSADVYRRANRPMPPGAPDVLMPETPAVGPAESFRG